MATFFSLFWRLTQFWAKQRLCLTAYLQVGYNYLQWVSESKVGVIAKTAVFVIVTSQKIVSRRPWSWSWGCFGPSRPSVREPLRDTKSGTDRDFNDPRRFGPLWTLWMLWIVKKPWFRSKKEPYSVDIRQKCSFFGPKSRLRDDTVMDRDHVIVNGLLTLKRLLKFKYFKSRNGPFSWRHQRD